jgi:hypothetical protein
MKTGLNATLWAVGITTCFAGAAQVMGVPVIEHAKEFISCLDGYGFNCH